MGDPFHPTEGQNQTQPQSPHEGEDLSELMEEQREDADNSQYLLPLPQSPLSDFAMMDTLEYVPEQRPEDGSQRELPEIDFFVSTNLSLSLEPSETLIAAQFGNAFGSSATAIPSSQPIQPIQQQAIHWPAASASPHTATHNQGSGGSSAAFSAAPADNLRLPRQQLQRVSPASSPLPNGSDGQQVSSGLYHQSQLPPPQHPGPPQFAPHFPAQQQPDPQGQVNECLMRIAALEAKVAALQREVKSQGVGHHRSAATPTALATQAEVAAAPTGPAVTTAPPQHYDVLKQHVAAVAHAPLCLFCNKATVCFPGPPFCGNQNCSSGCREKWRKSNSCKRLYTDCFKRLQNPNDFWSLHNSILQEKNSLTREADRQDDAGWCRAVQYFFSGRRRIDVQACQTCGRP